MIDDKAETGWKECLEYILKNNVLQQGFFTSIQVESEFQRAEVYTNYSDFDIIFLDLRLLITEDNNNQILDINQFSGSKILKRITDENKGIQVIMLTASNKIWTIEKLLNLGASGYYIKESPEYTLNEFSQENYISLIDNIKHSLNAKHLKKYMKFIKLVNTLSIQIKITDL